MNYTTMIIAGGSGNLATTKLLPALARYLQDHPESTLQVIALTRTPMSPQDLLNRLELPKSVSAESLAGRLKTISGDLASSQLYQEIARSCCEQQPGSRICYLACPPDLFITVLRYMVEYQIIRTDTQGMVADRMVNDRMVNDRMVSDRMVFEKPFGVNLASAQELEKTAQSLLNSEQIIRMDHYLAKDIVQTIMYTRVTNRLLQTIWNSTHVAAITIRFMQQQTIAMQEDLYTRVQGILGDVLQNHLLQLMSLITCRPPENLAHDTLTTAKLALLSRTRFESLRTSTYQGAPTRAPTYVLARAYIDDHVWQGVPLFFIAGKAMAQDNTSVTLHLKKATCIMPLACPLAANQITITIGPLSTLTLTLNVKTPATDHEIAPIDLDFCYDCQWPYSPPAYVSLITQLLENRTDTSVSYAEIYACWQALTSAPPALPDAPYPSGTAGPPAAQHWYEDQLSQALNSDNSDNAENAHKVAS